MTWQEWFNEKAYSRRAYISMILVCLLALAMYGQQRVQWADCRYALDNDTRHCSISECYEAYKIVRPGGSVNFTNETIKVI